MNPMTMRRLMRPGLLSSALLLVAALAGCQQGEQESSLTVVRAVDATKAANLAHPEFDLNVPVARWWMHDADASIINAKRAEGYRLISLDVLSESPLHFTAGFVFNTGVYQRAGENWDPSLTEAEVLAIFADSTRRIVDLAPYRIAGDRRYGAVWVDNPVDHHVDYTIVLHATPANFQAALQP